MHPAKTEEPVARKSNHSKTTTSQIRSIAQGAGAKQRHAARHSQQYQLNPPVRPTDGTAEKPPAGLGIRKKFN